MKKILDPSFRYRPSYATDLRRTFARLRRDQRAATSPRVRAVPVTVVLRKVS